MAQIEALIDKIKTFFWSLLDSIESSQVFETVAAKFSGLAEAQKLIIATVTKVLAIALVLFLVAYPLLEIFSHRNTYARFSDVFSRVARYRPAQEVKASVYKSPGGWREMPANSLSKLSASIEKVLKEMSVPKKKFQVTERGNAISVNVDELSVIQLVTFAHQIEGFFPAARFSEFQVRVNESEKELLSFTSVIEYQERDARKFSRTGKLNARSFARPSKRVENINPPPAQNNNFTDENVDTYSNENIPSDYSNPEDYPPNSIESPEFDYGNMDDQGLIGIDEFVDEMPPPPEIEEGD